MFVEVTGVEPVSSPPVQSNSFTGLVSFSYLTKYSVGYSPSATNKQWVIRFRVQSLFHLGSHSILSPTMCAGEIRQLLRNQHQRMP